MKIRHSHGLWVAVLTFVLGGCGGGQPVEMPQTSATPLTATAMAGLAVTGPSMEQVLAQPSIVRPPAQTDSASPTAKRLAAGTSAARYPDLIWLNATTGQTVSWTIDGVQPKRVNPLFQHPDWRLNFVADLNGDGQDDYIWENEKTGQMAVWLMNGPALADASEITLLLESPGWKVVFTGDFDGDGKADLIFYNAKTSQTVMWLMDGSRILESRLLAGEPGERVIGVGDLDGDGRSDLAWGGKDSTIETWLMQGSARTGGRRVACDASCQGTVPLALVDPDGSGRAAFPALTGGKNPSLLLLKTEAEGASAWSTATLGRLDDASGGAATQISALADLHGDGVVTALLRDPGSQANLALRTGKPDQSFSAPQPLVKLPGWSVERAADLDGDGKADLIWRHAGKGQTVVWLMNGLEAKAQGDLLQNPQWFVTNVRNATAKPQAVVGPSQTLQQPATVTLDGSASLARGLGGLSYQWSLVEKPTGSAATLSSASSPKPAFTPDVPGRYRVQLVVTRNGINSSAATVSVTLRHPPSVLSSVLLEPPSRAINASVGFDILFRPTKALGPGDKVFIEVPGEYGRLWDSDISTRRWDGVPSSVHWQSVRERVLSVAFDGGASNSQTVRLALYPSGNQAFHNPSQQGNYVFRVWTTTDPTPVEVPVQILTADTKLEKFQMIFTNRDSARETVQVAVDFITPSGLPQGARFFASLPSGVDGREAQLVRPNPLFQLYEAPTFGEQLIYIVTAPEGLPAGTRVTAEQTMVSGVRATACPTSDPRFWNFQVHGRTSQDLISSDGIEVLPQPLTTTSLSDVMVIFTRDKTWPQNGRWQLSLRGASGLPMGSRVHLKTDLSKIPGNQQAFSANNLFRQDLQCRDFDTYEIGENAAVPAGDYLHIISALVSAPAPGTYTFTVYTSLDNRPVTATATVD